MGLYTNDKWLDQVFPFDKLYDNDCQERPNNIHFCWVCQSEGSISSADYCSKYLLVFRISIMPVIIMIKTK